MKMEILLYKMQHYIKIKQQLCVLKKHVIKNYGLMQISKD